MLCLMINSRDYTFNSSASADPKPKAQQVECRLQSASAGAINGHKLTLLQARSLRPLNPITNNTLTPLALLLRQPYGHLPCPGGVRCRGLLRSRILLSVCRKAHARNEQEAYSFLSMHAHGFASWFFSARFVVLSCGVGAVQFCPEGGRSLNYPKTTLPLSCFVPETLWASVGRPNQSLSFLRVVVSGFQVRAAILKGRAVQYLVRMQLNSKSQHQKASTAHADPHSQNSTPKQH